MLTPKQRRLLLFINGYIQRHGMCPNYNDMAAAIGAKSRGHITAMIDRLEDRGFVRRIPNAARSIEIVRLEPGSVSDEAHANERLIDIAPELLDVVKLLTKFAKDAPGLDFKEDQNLSWIGVVTAKADALIAKVEG